MSLNLESKEGKLLMALMVERLKKEGIHFDPSVRNRNVEIEFLKREYGIELTLEEWVMFWKIVEETTLSKQYDKLKIAMVKHAEKEQKL